MSLSARPRSEDPALGLLRVIRQDGRTDPVSDPFLPPETLLAMHREMLRARVLDEVMIAFQRQGRIPSYHAGIGQEAVAIGAAHALESTDWVFPAFRENAVLLSRGLSLDAYLAQLFGNAADPQKGRQAPSNTGARSVYVASTSSSVATQLPHAVGMAFAARSRGVRSAVLGFVGEGGTSSGDFHAAMNFAGVFRVPCIIVVQNNQWAISTPVSRQTASSTFAIKGMAYGVPALRVDGNDILAVYRGVSDARVRAVAGAGPTLVECVTQRPGGPPSLHRRPDTETDTDRGDGETGDSATNTVAAPDAAPAPGDGAPAAAPGAVDHDPLRRLARHLTYLGILDEAAESALRAEITDEIARAVERAEALPAPDRMTLFDDVYAERPAHLTEQAAKLGRH